MVVSKMEITTQHGAIESKMQQTINQSLIHLLNTWSRII